jgi:hypothetical protein
MLLAAACCMLHAGCMLCRGRPCIRLLTVHGWLASPAGRPLGVLPGWLVALLLLRPRARLLPLQPSPACVAAPRRRTMHVVALPSEPVSSTAAAHAPRRW